jgi:hypothetical protein
MIGSAVPDWAEIIKAAGSGPWSILALICLILAFLGNTFFVKAAPGVKVLIFVLLLLAAVVGVGVYVSATALKGQLKEAKEKQEAAEKKAAELEKQLNDSKQGFEVWTVEGHILTDPDSPLQNQDELVFNTRPPLGDDDPADNAFTTHVMVSRNIDGTLAFPALHIGRKPVEKFAARTIYLNKNQASSDNAKTTTWTPAKILAR